MERTLILIKPDAFARNLTGEIIARFERKGLRLVAMNLMTMTRDLAARHYAEHEGKGFYEELVTFITSGPLVAMVLEGEQAVVAARQVIGATNPLQATTGLDPRRLRDRGRARTWSTARTRRSRPPARWRCSSPIWAEPVARAREPAGPRLALAPAAGDPRAAGRRVLCPGARRRGARAGPPHEVALENAYRKASAIAAAVATPVRRSSGVDTVVALGARLYGKPADPEEARTTLTALAGRRHAVVSGICLIEDGRLAHRGGADAGRVPGAVRGADRVVPGQRRMARAGRRIRHPGPRGGAGGGDRGRLPQRGRAAGADAARTGARPAWAHERAGCEPA